MEGDLKAKQEQNRPFRPVRLNWKPGCATSRSRPWASHLISLCPSPPLKHGAGSNLKFVGSFEGLNITTFVKDIVHNRCSINGS